MTGGANTGVAAQELRFSAQVDKTTVTVGEPMRLTITVNGERIPTPEGSRVGAKGSDPLVDRKRQADLREKLFKNELSRRGFQEVPFMGVVDTSTGRSAKVAPEVLAEINVAVEGEMQRVLGGETPLPTPTPPPAPSAPSAEAGAQSLGRPSQEQADAVVEQLKATLGREPSRAEVTGMLQVLGFDLSQ